MSARDPLGHMTACQGVAFGGTPFVVEIDLNGLSAEGEMSVHERWICSPAPRCKRHPDVGELVLAKDEWDDCWLARVVTIHGEFLRLAVDTSGPLPRATVSLRSPR